jgi:hypothetical protein
MEEDFFEEEEEDSPLLEPEIVSPSSSGGEDMIRIRMLVKAIASGVTDPKRLAEMAGFANAAKAMLTLDRIRNRKEIMDAFNRSGMDISYIVGKVKRLCDSTDDKSVKSGLDLMIKMTGLDRGETGDEGARSWEDALLQSGNPGGERISPPEDGIYEIEIPEVPEEEVERQKSEAKLAEDLYGLGNDEQV